jgi:hypothetical protein
MKRLYAYVDNANGNVCVVYVPYCIFLFQLEEFRIHNLQRTDAETAYSGTTTPSKSCYIGH